VGSLFCGSASFRQREENIEILGHMIICGFVSEYFSVENEEDYTTEQMQHFRLVLISQNRNDELNNTRRLILGDQAHDRVLTFTTSFSNEVLESWKVVKKSLSEMTDPSAKLDLLFAYSYNLGLFESWMEDNEGGMEKLVQELASAWKSLLNNHSDEELGWDCRYTKPGMLEFLDMFKHRIGRVPDYCSIGEFNFQ
jgi:hypothetical protein